MRLSRKYVLYTLSVIGSGCGFVSQILVSGYWSTSFSNDVHHFSINLAVYFLFLGFGSLMSSRWKTPNLKLLFELTLCLCFWTGLSIAFVRWGIMEVGELPLLPLLAVSVSAVLAGNVIPLTIKIGEETASIKLGTLFFLDYCAAIAFTLMFTFVFLVPYGYGMTAIFMSGFSVLCCVLLMYLAGELHSNVVLFALATLLIPYPVYKNLRTAAAPRLDQAGAAKVIINRQSYYQKIVLTEEDMDKAVYGNLKQHVLYLDGFVQFSSVDEQGYHICIANIPVAAVEYNGGRVKKALILGGGDGLAARNLINVKSIESVTNVELDPEVVNISKNEPLVRMYNLNSFRNERVNVVVADAFRWVKETKEKFDVIVVDFPAPKNIGLARLFTAEFYSDVFKLLNPGGFISIQAGPSFSFEDPTDTLARVPTCVRNTIRSLGFKANIYINSRDEDAFVLASKETDFDMTDFSKKIGILGRQGMGLICNYSPGWDEYKVGINTLNTLVLAEYMSYWFAQAGKPFFYYRGSHSVFLPD